MIGPPPRSPLFPYTTLFRSALFISVSRRCAGMAPACTVPSENTSVGVAFTLYFAPSSAVLATGLSHSPLLSGSAPVRSEEHTSELQSPCNLVCRLLLENTSNDWYARTVVRVLTPVEVADSLTTAEMTLGSLFVLTPAELLTSEMDGAAESRTAVIHGTA